MLEETLDVVRELRRSLPAAITELRGEIVPAILSARSAATASPTPGAGVRGSAQNGSLKEALLRRKDLIEIQLKHLRGESRRAEALRNELEDVKKQLD